MDVIYFRNYEKSPRKAVLKSISVNEKILDLCTGTGTNAIGIAKEKALQENTSCNAFHTIIK